LSRFCSSAASTAISSTTASRAKLSSTMPFRACARRSAPMRCRVFALSGTCSVRNSEPFSTSSIEAARFTDDGKRQALSTVMSGS
jgi:hypothetical protein